MAVFPLLVGGGAPCKRRGAAHPHPSGWPSRRRAKSSLPRRAVSEPGSDLPGAARTTARSLRLSAVAPVTRRPAHHLLKRRRVGSVDTPLPTRRAPRESGLSLPYG